jgi:hypothetical protein
MERPDMFAVESGREKSGNARHARDLEGRPSHDRHRMTKGRKEISPNEQLSELRKARDRYNALADQFRDSIEFFGKPEEKWARERDARRIAQAYEKSIQNMIVSCHARQIDMKASDSGSVAVKVAMVAFFIAAAGAAFVAVARPAIPKAVMASIMGTDAPAPVAKNRPPVASAAPAPASGNPATSAVPVPSPRPAADRHPAVRTNPVASAATRDPRIRHHAKTIDDGAGHFVVKVLQPDGSLKEQSFSSTPSH